MAFHLPKKQFTATVFARTLREAHCEKCGADYVYVLTLRAEETRSTSLLSPMKDAEEAATKAAAKALSSQFKGGVSPVPCPACGWLQADMVDHLRANRAPWPGVLAVFAILIGAYGLLMAAILAVINLADNDPKGTEFIQKVLFVSLVLAIAGAIVLTVCNWWVRRWDPNDCDLVAQAARGRQLSVLKHEHAEAELVAKLAAADEDQRSQERRRFAGDLRFRAIGTLGVTIISLVFLGSQWGLIKAGVASYTWPQTT